MIKKYGILGFSCLALLAAGCGDSSSSSGASALSYPAEINEEAKTISMTIPTCEQISNTEVHFDPEGEKNTFEYELSGTSLFLDDGFDITEFTGNNSSLYGTWTIAEEGCEEFGCDKIKITSTSVTRTTDMSGICAFDYMVASMFSEESDDGEEVIPDYTKTSCTSGTINMQGKIINVNISKFNETGTDVSVTVDGQKCRMYMNAKPLTASLCTIENLELIEDGMFMENNMIEFMQCYIPLFMDGFEEYGSNSDLILEKSKKLKSMSKIFSAK